MTEMHDDYHKIKLALTTDSSNKILDSTGVFEGVVLRKINQLIPRNEGCTHIYEMLESSFQALFAASQKKSDARSVKESRDITNRIPSLASTCVSFEHS